jgi:hypothetical protein
MEKRNALQCFFRRRGGHDGFLAGQNLHVVTETGHVIKKCDDLSASPPKHVSIRVRQHIGRVGDIPDARGAGGGAMRR